MNGIFGAALSQRNIPTAARFAAPLRPNRLRTKVMSPDQPTPQAPDGRFADCIVAIAERGDRAAFGELFEHFGPRVKSFFMRAGMAQAQAEDLAQETMLTVWRRASQYDPARAGASTWIFVIARNLRIDLFRRQKSEQTALSAPVEAFDPPVLVDETLATAQSEARVRAALAQLSAEQQSVIRLSFFSDTPHGEIAAQLGIPLGTVKSRIRLAVARLREILGEL
jgi:RNA polymerase sigma-70 factor (ECF subfamily)